MMKAEKEAAAKAAVKGRREKAAAPRSMRDVLYEAPGKKARRWIVLATILSFAALIFLIVYILYVFNENGQFDEKYWYFFARATTWRFIGNGLLGTVEAALLGGIIAFAIAFLMMLGRICGNKILNVISIALIEFTRGVPTLLFIYFFFLVVPQMGVNLPSILRISLPVAISASGVVAEVLRSGVNAVPKGQREAALSIGMREGQAFFKVIFPQAIRMIVPALISELVIVVKDTTFSYVVNFPDLMQNARVLISNYDALLSVYLVTAVIYILINVVLNQLSVSIANRQGTPRNTAVQENI